MKVSHIVFVVVVLNRSAVVYSLPAELVHYVFLYIIKFSVNLIQFWLEFLFCDSFLFKLFVYFLPLIFVITTDCEPLFYRIPCYFCHLYGRTQVQPFYVSSLVLELTLLTFSTTATTKSSKLGLQVNWKKTVVQSLSDAQSCPPWL